jgi:membrane protein implicated in regulation of membrane protease activity
MNKLKTIAIGILALASLALAGAFAVSMIGFFLVAFALMMGVILVLAILSTIAVKIFGAERVEAWLARRGIKINLSSDKPQTNEPAYRRTKDQDGIEDAVILEETPGPRRPNQ